MPGKGGGQASACGACAGSAPHACGEGAQREAGERDACQGFEAPEGKGSRQVCFGNAPMPESVGKGASFQKGWTGKGMRDRPCAAACGTARQSGKGPDLGGAPGGKSDRQGQRPARGQSRSACARKPEEPADQAPERPSRA